METSICCATTHHAIHLYYCYTKYSVPAFSSRPTGHVSIYLSHLSLGPDRRAPEHSSATTLLQNLKTLRRDTYRLISSSHNNQQSPPEKHIDYSRNPGVSKPGHTTSLAKTNCVKGKAGQRPADFMPCCRPATT